MDPLMKKEGYDWPYMESMTRILKDNPTVTLENVSEVVDSVKMKVNRIPTQLRKSQK